MPSGPSDSIDHSGLVRLVEAGAVRSASVIGQRAGWGVIVRYGRGATARPLVAKRGQVRLFRKLETVVSYLKEMGIAKFEVDARNFDGEKLRTTRSRPDSKRIMKRAHAAVLYDEWFREQVKLGLADLAAGNTVSESEHETRWSKRRSALEKRSRRA